MAQNIIIPIRVWIYNMKILIIIFFFLLLRMLFKNLLSKKNNSKYSDKEKNDEIIDVEYEELEWKQFL